jgi:hypothetical protein
MASVQNAARLSVQTAPAEFAKYKTDETFVLPFGRENCSTELISIQLTHDVENRMKAVSLINRRYAWRGYGSNQKLSGRKNETTFTAWFDGSLIGTITLVADSDRGLAVDTTFPSEMQFFRGKANARLCELKKFAVDCRSTKHSKAVLASLFHFVFIFGTTNFLGTDLFIEVNPRHIAFYDRMLGFERVGGLKTNEDVNAPSQLMWLSVAKIGAYIESGLGDRGRNSLYNYFYAPQRQQEIARELQRRGLAA